MALGNVLVDALARELVISRDWLSLNGLARYARYREWSSLPDRLNVVRSPFDLLGYFGFEVGHNFFDKLPVIINAFPAADIAPDLLGKEDFIAPSQHFRDRRQSPLV